MKYNKTFRVSSLSLFCVIFTLVFSGCASVGPNIDQAQTDRIQKLKTTKAELIAMFGRPTSTTLQSDGKEIFIWIYSKAKVKGATFVPIYGIFRGGSDVDLKTLQVVLNKSKVVEDFSWNATAIELRNMR